MATEPSLNELLGLDPVPELIHNPAEFSEFLNFEDFSQPQSHSGSSPNTISVNHTPSPHSFGPSPPQYQAGDFTFDFSDQQQKYQPQFAGPSTVPLQYRDVNVKQEPAEYLQQRHLMAAQYQQQQQMAQAQQQMPQQVPAQQPMAPNDQQNLPMAQQAALQQLLASFAQYEQQFGGQPVEDPASAINPSLLAANSLTTPSTPGTSSLTPASHAASYAGPSTAQIPPAPESVDEPLNSISESEMPPSRSARAASTGSNMSEIDDKIDKLVPLSAIFSAGRGKGGKKGGGMSSVVRAEGEEVDDDESWRPSPEEYKKLSSKEKRQLRNKLSARAFRTRRKDYIGTLEAHIKDRDQVIDAIREQLSQSAKENQDLRRELEMLKASTQCVLHPESAATVGQSPAMLTALSEGDGSRSRAQAHGRRAPAVGVNTRKDLAPFDSSRGFWGGSDSLAGGSTICHTVITPEICLPEQPNVNPLLNALNKKAAEEKASPKSEKKPLPPLPEKHLSVQDAGDRKIDGSTFAEWAEDTPYNVRSLDSYRMQLWSRLAREAAADKANIPAAMRPKFLVDPASPSARKESGASVPASSAATSVSTLASAAVSATATVASRLTSSFWSAFTGPSSKIDGDKLADVVTGRARLAVVPDTRRSNVANVTNRVASSTDDLAHAMAGLRVATGGQNPRESIRTRNEGPLSSMTGFLKNPSLSTRAA